MTKLILCYQHALEMVFHFLSPPAAGCSICYLIGVGVLFDENLSNQMDLERPDSYSLIYQSIQSLSGMANRSFEDANQVDIETKRICQVFLKGLAILREKADSGDPRAQRMIARHYLGKFGRISHIADQDHISPTRGTEVCC
jgi:hypothetical protein